ncbi:MAG TPA: porin family protein, partial [Reyranella sp.]
MNRLLAVGIVLACLVVGTTSASASDLPARSNPRPAAAPAEAAFSWTGFYAGINAGYAWGQSSWSDPAAGANSGNFDTSGGLVGGQLGYNWQTGAFVLGVETD